MREPKNKNLSIGMPIGDYQFLLQWADKFDIPVGTFARIVLTSYKEDGINQEDVERKVCQYKDSLVKRAEEKARLMREWHKSKKEGKA